MTEIDAMTEIVEAIMFQGHSGIPCFAYNMQELLHRGHWDE